MSGSDFLSTTGTLTCLDGDMTPKSFQVRLLSDAVADPNESLIVMLSSATGASVGTPSSAVIATSDVAGSPTTSPGKRRSTKR